MLAHGRAGLKEATYFGCFKAQLHGGEIDMTQSEASRIGAHEVLGIIPARGGSKGVPRKNIKPLLGKPLIAYTIEEAFKSRYIKRLIVSTDDEEISEVAKAYGADVPFLRPSDLAEDHVTDLPVFQHALKYLRQTEGYRPNIIAHLRPTAPLRTHDHIDQGIELLVSSRADSVRSVCIAPKHPCKMWKFEGQDIVPFLPKAICGEEAYNLPRQSLPSVYIQNGSVDVAWWNTIMEKNSMTGKRIVGMLMKTEDSVNIDTEVDFLVAEVLLKKRMERRA